MELYLFRHGETYNTKNQIPYGDKEETAEILAEAVSVIRKLAFYLKDEKMDAIYSSPYLRCVQTVEIVGEVTGKSFILEERIGEFIPERETVERFIIRIKDFYNYLQDQKLESVSICTHGYVLSALVQLATKREISTEGLEIHPNPGELILIKKGAVKKLDFNS